MKLLSIIFILVFAFTAFGQTNFKTILVRVSVASSDPALQSLLLKKVNAEISLIKDIEVTDKAHIFELEIVAMPIKTSTDFFVGYALSTTMARTVLCQEFLGEKDVYKPFDVVERHAITLTDKLRLDKDIKEIVGTFNSKLDPVRKEMPNLKVIIHDRKN